MKLAVNKSGRHQLDQSDVKKLKDSDIWKSLNAQSEKDLMQS